MADSQHYYHHHLGPPTLNEQANSRYNVSMLYCGFFVIITVGLILGMYHCIALNWCSFCPFSRLQIGEPEASYNHKKFNAKKVTELDSTVFKYKKKGENNGTSNEECAVCLSVFEEGEDVRKLVRCKHSYHAPCIDMWLYSHFECPLCRTPVCDRNNSGVAQSDDLNSGAGFSDSGALPV